MFRLFNGNVVLDAHGLLNIGHKNFTNVMLSIQNKIKMSFLGTMQACETKKYIHPVAV